MFILMVLYLSVAVQKRVEYFMLVQFGVIENSDPVLLISLFMCFPYFLQNRKNFFGLEKKFITHKN